MAYQIYDRIACLQFDHMEDKEFNIASGKALSLERIKKEIKKCQVLCANCHAVKTAKDNNWYNFSV